MSVHPEPAEDEDPDGRLFGLARHWLDVRRPERALDTLGQLSGAAAMSPPALRMRAEALLMLERPVEAAQAAETALAQSGPDPELLHALAFARKRLGDHAGAERALLEGLGLDPADVSLLCLYAQVCAEVGQVEKAQRLLSRAERFAPDAPPVRRTRVLLALVRGDDAEAVRHGRDALGEDPHQLAYQTLYGVAAAVRGQMGEAYRMMRNVAAADPGDADAVELAREAKAAAHPLMWPLRPIQRFGPAPVWLAAVATMVGLNLAGLGPVAAVVAMAWVCYCVYSWVVPPLVRRRVRRGR